MASSLGLYVGLIATMFIAVGASNQYKVGNEVGWRFPDKNETNVYEKWASKIRFQVGDSVLFEYRNDSVVRVDKRGYYHCNESSRGMAFKDGNTVFLLDKSGFYYFVSGDIDHCKKGQRVMIDVMAPPSPPTAPLSPAPSPQPSAACSVPSPRSAILVLATFLMLSWHPSDSTRCCNWM